tara:strand:+ start:827 stop:2386 length:1560 start_codon:yes stop_codon:yes gene_type:complete
MNIDEYSEEEEERAYLLENEVQFKEMIEYAPEEDYGLPPPKLVRDYIESAIEVSHGNSIPAAISCFSILGQITKDFITIPKGRNLLDTRIHFCWIQTSGTGKSTLWNFIKPVSEGVYKLINEGNHPARIGKDLLNDKNEEMASHPRTFDTFSLVDYTDAVLIGNWGEEKQMETDPDSLVDKWTGEMIPKRNAGMLEGSGLAHWDEFEYSGIFKQSLHQEKAIPYLNTLMNSLAYEDGWVIDKALVSFDNKVMECFCERSVLAMTYPPENLIDVIATKGVLQRMLMYVKNVPKEVQHKMRIEQLGTAGIIIDNDAPVEKFSNAIHHVYKLTQERFSEVGGDPLKTITYGSEFQNTLKLAYLHMQEDLLGTPLEVDKVADNFTTRMLDMLIKMSVLCCIAESPSIDDRSQRFIVTGKNVRQAERIVRQCYISLVSWLKQSLTGKKRSITDKTYDKAFKIVFKDMKKNANGFVHKTTYLQKVIDYSEKSKSQVYRIMASIEDKFIEQKEGRRVFIKLKGDEE